MHTLRRRRDARLSCLVNCVVLPYRPAGLWIRTKWSVTMTFLRRLGPCLAAVVLLSLTAGCGAGDGVSRGAVEGSVTFKGEPLADGVIRFIPTGDTTGPMTEAKIKDGGFRLSQAEGPCVGTNRIEVFSFVKTGKKIRNEGVETEEVRQIIPPQYNTKTTLNAAIAAGENTLPAFELVQ